MSGRLLSLLLVPREDRNLDILRDGAAQVAHLAAHLDDQRVADEAGADALSDLALRRPLRRGLRRALRERQGDP